MKKITSYIFILIYLSIGLVGPFQAFDKVIPQYYLLSIITITHTLYNYKKENFSLFTPVFSILLFLLFFIGLLSVSWSYNIPENLIHSSKFFLLFAIFFNTYHTLKDNNKLIKFSFIIIAFMSIIESSAIFLQFLDNYQLAIIEKIGRSELYKGFAGNINIAAFSVLFKSVFLLYFLHKSKSKIVKILIILILTFCFFAVSLTGSRGALLAQYIIIFIYCFHNFIEFFRSKSIKHIFKGLNIIFPFAAVLYLTELLFNTLRVSFRTLEIINRGSPSRVRYWQDALQGFFDHPFGVGFGNWKIESIFYNREYISNYIIPYHAHNDYLEIIAELGIFGIFILSFLFYFTFRMLKRQYLSSNNQEKLIALFIGIALTVFFIDLSLNFPLKRPIISLTSIILLAILCLKENRFNIKLNLSIVNYVTLFIIITSASTTYVFNRYYNASIEHKNFLLDYNKNIFDDPLETIIDDEEKFPNLTSMGFPIIPLKANYYFENKDTINSIKIIKDAMKSVRDNPHTGIHEATLANIYNRVGQYDSALKYSKIAYTKLPNNLFHASNLMFASRELKQYDIFDSIFNKNKNNNESVLWELYISTILTQGDYSKNAIQNYLSQYNKIFDENKIYRNEFYNQVYGIENVINANNLSSQGDKKYREKNFEEAYQYYRNASKLIPLEYTYYQNMALAKSSLREIDEAISLLSFSIDSLDIPKNQGRIYAIRGGLYVQKNNLQKACSDFALGAEKSDDLSKQFLVSLCPDLAINLSKQ